VAWSWGWRQPSTQSAFIKQTIAMMSAHYLDIIIITNVQKTDDTVQVSCLFTPAAHQVDNNTHNTYNTGPYPDHCSNASSFQQISTAADTCTHVPNDLTSCLSQLVF